MGEMIKIELQSSEEKIPEIKKNPREEIAEFAKLCYKHEPGTKRAVDKGLITMKELEIYHYINAWTIHNVPYIEGQSNEDEERALDEMLKNGYKKAKQIYSISEEEAQEIFEKVCKISRS